MTAACFDGEVEKAFPAFAWCLARCDNQPEVFDIESILWEYKWIVLEAGQVPTVPLDRIVGLWEDASKRFRERGYSLRPLYHLTYLDQARNDDRAFRVFESHLPWACDTMSSYSAFRFFRASLRFIERYAEHNPKLCLSRPVKDFDVEPIDERLFESAAVADWLRAEAGRLGDLFDQRNGKEEFRNRLESNAPELG